jgi:hypothetical protein
MEQAEAVEGYEPQNAKNLDESGPTGIYFAGKQLKPVVICG